MHQSQTYDKNHGTQRNKTPCARGRQVVPDWIICSLAARKIGEARQARNFGGHLSLKSFFAGAAKRTLGKRERNFAGAWAGHLGLVLISFRYR